MGSLRQADIEMGIALLRLDRPERRNALDSGLLIELADALEVDQRKGAGLPQGPRPG